MIAMDVKHEGHEREYAMARLRGICKEKNIKLLIINLILGKSIIFLKDKNIILISEKVMANEIHIFIEEEFTSQNEIAHDLFLLTDLLTV